MKRVTHTLKNGCVDVTDMPALSMNERFVHVRTQSSVISARTEKSKIYVDKKGLLQKARWLVRQHGNPMSPEQAVASRVGNV